MEDSKTSEDLELQALELIRQALEGLDQETRQRVLQWAVGRFGKDCEVPQRGGRVAVGVGAASAGSGQAEGLDLASFFGLANPSAEFEKALTVAYWMARNGTRDFSSYAVNRQLKDLGHGIANITSALGVLVDRKHVIQLKKSGKTQQARKLYRVTNEGMRAVDDMQRGSV